MAASPACKCAIRMQRLNSCSACTGGISSSSELKRLLESDGPISSGFHAAAKLAWGVMLRIIGDDNHQTEGKSATAYQTSSKLAYMLLCMLVT